MVLVHVVDLETGESWIEYEEVLSGRQKLNQVGDFLRLVFKDLMNALWKTLKFYFWLLYKLIPIAFHILMYCLRLTVYAMSVVLLLCAIFAPRW